MFVLDIEREKGKRERVCVCVCVCERERERARVCLRQLGELRPKTYLTKCDLFAYGELTRKPLLRHGDKRVI